MSTMDQKLIHLVKKYISNAEETDYDDNNLPNADDIVKSLRAQHREYQRKDMNKLKRQVQKILTIFNEQQQQEQQQQEGKAREEANNNNDDDDDDNVMEESSTTTNSNGAKKRTLERRREEMEYERKARKHDEERNAALQNSSILNSALVQRYRKLSQERDAEARAEMAKPHNPDDSKGERNITNNNNNNNKNNNNNGSAVKSTNKTMKRKVKRNTTKSNGLDGLNPENLGMNTEAVPRPSERYTDLGGMDDVLKQIRQLVEYPLVRPELFRHLGVNPPRGILLRGPPGCGKTHMANAIAGQLGVTYFRVSAPELVSGMSGESEARIRELFQAASDAAPSIIFLDELDAIAPKRSESGSSRGMEKRMVAQLLTSFDMLDPKYNQNNATVIVLGATNRSDSIDPALRRAGRFDKEILLGVPDEEARIGILKTMTKGMKLDGEFNYKILARQIPGYVGADIRSLITEAAIISINRIFRDVLKDSKLPSDMDLDNNNNNNNNKDENKPSTSDTDIQAVVPLSKEEMEPLFVTMQDFLDAIPLVQPSSKREGFATVPDVSWDDIGALGPIREELTLSVLEPIRNPEKFKALGIPLPAGVMLYGPPGCGKTLLAKAIANESGANFISVKGPELLDKYVGESERSVRLVFERARASSPCVVFFDELDSLCRKRGSDDSGSGASERVVNQLLTEMDGLESRRSVFVIAATNRPELIDPAMMRPGRLDKLLYVPLPTPDERVSILKAISGGVNLSRDVDLEKIGRSPRADGYSGADCAALLREAGLAVLKESTEENSAESTCISIMERHFNYAFQHVVPSVSRKDQMRYNRMRDRMAHARSRGAVVAETSGEEAVEDLEGTNLPSTVIKADAEDNHGDETMPL